MKYLVLILLSIFNHVYASNDFEGVGHVECLNSCQNYFSITKSNNFYSGYTPAIGNIDESIDGQIIKYTGYLVKVKPTDFECQFYHLTNQECPTTVEKIKITSYEIISNVGDTHHFLVTTSGKWTSKNFPCLMSNDIPTFTKGNKTFSWDISLNNDVNYAILKVRITDTLGSFPNNLKKDKVFYELSFHGKTGDFLGITSGPGDFKPSCL